MNEEKTQELAQKGSEIAYYLNSQFKGMKFEDILIIISAYIADFASNLSKQADIPFSFAVETIITRIRNTAALWKVREK